MNFQLWRSYRIGLTGILIFLFLHCTRALKGDFALIGDDLNSLKNHPHLNFEEEYKLFEKELSLGTAKHAGRSRQKRYIYWNTEANVDVGFLIVIPITVVLPSMTNLFNNWRRKRSLSNLYTNVTYEDNPIRQRQVDQISSYFELINIPETACQLRAICEFAADPTEYFPLSDIILSKVKDPMADLLKSSAMSNGSADSTLLTLYSTAADNGSLFGTKQCMEVYNDACKYSTDKLLNLPVMKFWRKLRSKLQLKFDDVSEFSVV